MGHPRPGGRARAADGGRQRPVRVPPRRRSDVDRQQGRGRMNRTWGVYGIRGRLAGGKECAPENKAAVSYFIRWRVNGTMRRRSFKTRTRARTFLLVLENAKDRGWPADELGWPLDPSLPPPEQPRSSSRTPLRAVLSSSYVNEVWWPTSVTLADKSRLGHRRNADLAVQLAGGWPASRRRRRSSSSTAFRRTRAARS